MSESTVIIDVLNSRTTHVYKISTTVTVCFLLVTLCQTKFSSVNISWSPHSKAICNKLVLQIITPVMHLILTEYSKLVVLCQIYPDMYHCLIHNYWWSHLCVRVCACVCVCVCVCVCFFYLLFFYFLLPLSLCSIIDTFSIDITLKG